MGGTGGSRFGPRHRVGDHRFVDDDDDDDDAAGGGSAGDAHSEAARHTEAMAARVRAEKAARRAAAQREREAEAARARAERLATMTPKQQMKELLGFTGFGSTKNRKVESNFTGAACGAVFKPLRREYRQYMHRKGGFNKSLDK